MTNSWNATNTQICCPVCQSPLAVPAEAYDQPVRCPHCQATFEVGADVDASSPRVVLRRSRVLTIPKSLFGPALALVFFGLAGTLVNGYLSLKFTFQPGADREFARARVSQIRTAGILAEAKDQARDQAAPRGDLPSADAPLSPAEEALAEAWAPSMRPIHLGGLISSLLTLTGAICILWGRHYTLAILGCFTSALNVDPICCVPGGIAGIWGFLMLIRDEGHRHFSQRREATASFATVPPRS